MYADWKTNLCVVIIFKAWQKSPRSDSKALLWPKNFPGFFRAGFQRLDYLSWLTACSGSIRAGIWQWRLDLAVSHRQLLATLSQRLTSPRMSRSQGQHLSWSFSKSKIQIVVCRVQYLHFEKSQISSIVELWARATEAVLSFRSGAENGKQIAVLPSLLLGQWSFQNVWWLAISPICLPCSKDWFQ